MRPADQQPGLVSHLRLGGGLFALHEQLARRQIGHQVNDFLEMVATVGQLGVLQVHLPLDGQSGLGSELGESFVEVSKNFLSFRQAALLNQGIGEADLEVHPSPAELTSIKPALPDLDGAVRIAKGLENIAQVEIGLPVTRIGPHDALVQVNGLGICGSARCRNIQRAGLAVTECDVRVNADCDGFPGDSQQYLAAVRGQIRGRVKIALHQICRLQVGGGIGLLRCTHAPLRLVKVACQINLRCHEHLGLLSIRLEDTGKRRLQFLDWRCRAVVAELPGQHDCPQAQAMPLFGLVGEFGLFHLDELVGLGLRRVEQVAVDQQFGNSALRLYLPIAGESRAGGPQCLLIKFDRARVRRAVAGFIEEPASRKRASPSSGRNCDYSLYFAVAAARSCSSARLSARVLIANAFCRTL